MKHQEDLVPGSDNHGNFLILQDRNSDTTFKEVDMFGLGALTL